EGSIDVGADKFVRTEDGTIDMTLGRKVDDCGGLMIVKDSMHESAVVDVAAHKFVAGIADQRRQVGRIAGVGEAIEVDDRRRLLSEPLQDEVGADEPGAAGHDDRFSHKGPMWSFVSNVAIARCAPLPRDPAAFAASPPSTARRSTPERTKAQPIRR